jgi:hypothetical protein
MMTISIDNGYFNYNCPCCTLWFDESNFRNHLPYQATELIIDGLKELCKTLEMQTPPKGAMVIPESLRTDKSAKEKVMQWWKDSLGRLN